MDVGTKEEPGRELDANAVQDVSGGHVSPDRPEDPPIDPLGGSGGAPVDYSAASGGDGVDPPGPFEPPSPSDNPIWRVLQDWFGSTNP